ncbi:hypothetical protein NFI96_002489 [Prochilodus magdalenae]|nr:hypothetical protein NFI96_002489 [Prochilodus magdalenae]
MWLSLGRIPGFFSAVARLECFRLPPMHMRSSFKTGLSFSRGLLLGFVGSCHVDKECISFNQGGKGGEATEAIRDDDLQLLESRNPMTCLLDPIPSTLLQSISLDLLPFISFLINCPRTSTSLASTETALIAVTERLQTARSAKLSSVLILLDLSASFDTINHKILLSVLTNLGITGTAWKWFESYLEVHHYQLDWICWRMGYGG